MPTLSALHGRSGGYGESTGPKHHQGLRPSYIPSINAKSWHLRSILVIWIHGERLRTCSCFPSQIHGNEITGEFVRARDSRDHASEQRSRTMSNIDYIMTTGDRTTSILRMTFLFRQDIGARLASDESVSSGVGHGFYNVPEISAA